MRSPCTMLLFSIFALAAGRAHADAGDLTATFSVGTSFLQEKFATGTKPASLTTIGNSFSPSEFIGAGYFITDRLRVGLNLQFTEAIAVPDPQPPNAFTTFALLPQVSYRFWWRVYAALIGFFPLRYAGIGQAGYGLQALLGVSLPLDERWSVTAALEVPVLIQPVTYVGLTPIAGLAYRL